MFVYMITSGSYDDYRLCGLVSSTEKHDIKKLRHEFERIANDKPELVSVLEKSAHKEILRASDAFAEWLVQEKGFAKVEYEEHWSQE